ncbi:MAG: A24 family peptidase [Phycisphaerales bacterium]|nr:A24 family peptidase [Phycisphaerales bacterium]
MPDWLIYMLPALTILLFVTAVGACIGSLINVLVYRIPLGLDVVTPSSKCPSCNHKLSWRENIPIFGWILLRGKCRFCKCKISPEYPIVEAVVAVLFGSLYALWYVVPNDAILGLGRIAPEWAANGPGWTWPAFVVLLVLVGCMVAMTIIDAKTTTIPLVLTWVPALAALVLHTGHAVWFQTRFGNPIMMPAGIEGVWAVPNAHQKWITAPGEVWTFATGGLVGWRFIGIGIGGATGLVLSNLFLKFGWLHRSFEDFDEWYESHHKSVQEPVEDSTDADELPEYKTDNATEIESIEKAETELPPESTIDSAKDDEDSEQPEESINDWLMYPHARREMIRELAFLCLPVLCGLGGGWLAMWFVEFKYGQGTIDPLTGNLIPPVNAPIWLVVLGAVLMGYLIAGGVVWAVRIGGTLAFGKEAMGLGDVHMMAAVGACLGWIDPTIAFFLAAFVGVAYAIAAQIMSGKLNRAMPYGPFLAVATMMVVLGKPLIELGLGRIFGMSGPLNLP